VRTEICEKNQKVMRVQHRLETVSFFLKTVRRSTKYLKLERIKEKTYAMNALLNL
jgi:hypothetical protein